jgi:hypothetical protein
VTAGGHRAIVVSSNTLAMEAVAALGPGATSWTAPLDAVRLGPDDDDTEVTAAQLREVIGRLAAAGAWREGDPDIIVVMDAGYDVIRLAWLLAGLPVVPCARLRSNRVFYRVPPPKPPHLPGRAREHGAPVKCGDQATWTARALTCDGGAGRRGAVHVLAWDRMHPKLCKDAAWAGHQGKVPIIECTLIQLRPDRWPGYRELTPMWLWASVTGAAEQEITTLWQACLRRFDLEDRLEGAQQAHRSRGRGVHHEAVRPNRPGGRPPGHQHARAADHRRLARFDRNRRPDGRRRCLTGAPCTNPCTNHKQKAPSMIGRGL